MKKNFENTHYIFILYIMFLFLLTFSFYELKSRFYTKYYITEASITNYQQLTMILDSSIWNQLNKNKTIYIEGNRKQIHIQKVTRNLIKKNGKNYHQVIITTKLNSKYQLLDTVTVTIYQKKRSLLTIFEACWKGEKNARTKT